MASTVATSQKHLRDHPCPVCGRHANLPAGQRIRDWGYTSLDGYAHCTRPEYAGGIALHKDGTYPHRLTGSCRCGRDHRGALADFAQRRPPPAKAAKAANVSRDFVARIWRDTFPAAGTLVESYLRGRVIDGPIPPTIRYAPALRHTPTGRTLPAMVSAVALWPAGRVEAIHRTYLSQDGSGKSDAQPNRMMLGPVAGGAVWLAAPAATMAVAEGIETALSVQQSTGLPTWAALSAVGIECLRLPDLPLASTVIVAADNDGAGLRAAYSAAERWIAEGRTVRLATPPGGHNDFNDALRAEA